MNHVPSPDRTRRGPSRTVRPRRERTWLAAAAVAAVPLVPLAPVGAPAAHADVAPGAGSEELVERIEEALDDPALEGATSGVLVEDPETGEVLYGDETGAQLMPASNMKMFTAAAALEALGPDHTFETRVVAENADGAPSSVEDLHLVGGGDPTLSADDIDTLAAEVADAGVEVVEGDLLADDSRFDGERLVDDWWEEDEPFAYGAQISALTVAHGDRFDTGVTEVAVEPAGEGEAVTVDLGAADGYAELDNSAETGAPGSEDTLQIDRPTGTNTIEVTGSLPADAGAVEELRTVDEPAGLAGHLFAGALEEHGVEVQGDLQYGQLPGEWDDPLDLAGHTSPELAEILVPFMKFSNNAHAEMLVKEMGQEAAGEGSWETGLAELESTLEGIGVDTAQLELNDGSGLSRSNLVTASTVSDLLVQARGAEWSEDFRTSLPVAGESDPFVGGTLSERMTDSAAEGVLTAKTGTLSGVSALSGYVPAPDGGELVFSVVNNGHEGAAPTHVQDAIGIAVAEHLGHGAGSGAAPLRAGESSGGEVECSWSGTC
ncbi:D-alanyl-D-alanine carboxypeptidase/D-alanyl-D-alanine-endopeptidase [Nocardiopsis sp. HNM0947]|uniref:D-alanyl-D-alanine carboxypeptidase/D-alanyl-D-alanine-endopeptidase n=1 Tax=Nocardiopsis coralli TaxID=2772213 RepID=A0ABR9P399_9ACTN|nr:D-alanyl-D-alanine carboxypeptidase/D-alanyl-D-alanine-endopeptidase [Nocardiopsis coralli]MBE2998330.1 D-alanyl-D-alanine carboxypeptidase/D-alanyl-D-alanine-endopeptidase [Nocardiopsis coralli]